MQNLTHYRNLLILSFLSACATPRPPAPHAEEPPAAVLPAPEPSPLPSPSPTPNPAPVPKPQPDCSVLPGSEDTVQLGKIALPATGKFYLESHLVQPGDKMPPGRTWPPTGTYGIPEHLKASYEAARRVWIGPMPSIETLYADHWSRVWTGSEGGGDIGNGARRIKPTIDCEPWIFNLYWKASSFPPPYTRYLICKGNKCVAACGGMEVGPGLRRFAGAQTELIKYLGGDTFTIRGRMKNQSTPFGPIKCQ